MNVLVVLIPISLILGGLGLVAFVWTVRSQQYDDDSGNAARIQRRAFSLRYVGDDARYTERPGPTSPPFPGHGMRPGERLREDWFPTVWPAPDPAAEEQSPRPARLP